MRGPSAALPPALSRPIVRPSDCPSSVPHQGFNRIPQLRDALSRPRARHDRLVLVQPQGRTELALAPPGDSPRKLVTLGDRRKDARRRSSELVVHVAILVRGVTADVEQPEDAGEPGA